MDGMRAVLRGDPNKPLRETSELPDLFKYSGLGDDRLKWVEGMVLRGEFYFPYPFELNDPFEFRPRFVVPPGDPVLHPFKLRKFLRERGPSHGLSREQIKRRPDRSVREIADYMTNSWRTEEEARKVQMFCMATVKDHPLLWAHYADGHRGVCIQLDGRFIPFAASLDVHYSVEYPTIPILERPPDAEVFRRLVRVKGLEWKYEREYRIVRHLESPTADLGLKWNGQLALASPNSIVGVTLGARISSEHQQAILRMAHGRLPRLPVWKAKPDEQRFSFNFERLA